MSRSHNAPIMRHSNEWLPESELMRRQPLYLMTDSDGEDEIEIHITTWYYR